MTLFDKLAVKGKPHAFWFKLIGFVVVGMLLFAFGLTYGSSLKDKVLLTLLSFFGLRSVFTAIPVDLRWLMPPRLPHIPLQIILVGSWIFGLSRIGYNHQIEKRINDWSLELFLYGRFQPPFS